MIQNLAKSSSRGRAPLMFSPGGEEVKGEKR
jgi:hypothetical protein